MKYVSFADGYQLDRYFDYLAKISPFLPKAARDFATCPEHFNTMSNICLHDSWVNSVVIREVAAGSRLELRSLEIEVALLGAFHNCIHRLQYKNVQNYNMTRGKDRSDRNVAHGDWMIDELTIVQPGVLCHEVSFSEGGVWLIECADVVHTICLKEAET